MSERSRNELSRARLHVLALGSPAGLRHGGGKSADHLRPAWRAISLLDSWFLCCIARCGTISLRSGGGRRHRRTPRLVHHCAQNSCADRSLLAAAHRQSRVTQEDERASAGTMEQIWPEERRSGLSKPSEQQCKSDKARLQTAAPLAGARLAVPQRMRRTGERQHQRARPRPAGRSFQQGRSADSA